MFRRTHRFTSLLLSLALFALTGLTAPAQEGGIVEFRNSRTIELVQQLEQQSIAGIKELKLWVTRDGGQNWSIAEDTMSIYDDQGELIIQGQVMQTLVGHLTNQCRFACLAWTRQQDYWGVRHGFSQAGLNQPGKQCSRIHGRMIA